MAATTIAKIYKYRWQIEILFKRLKQNYPLKYFLGDNENAIRIQIWCALIADLIVNVIKNQLKRKWSFANITSMIRLHLMTYTESISWKIRKNAF
jgi:IS4 transposase